MFFEISIIGYDAMDKGTYAKKLNELENVKEDKLNLLNEKELHARCKVEETGVIGQKLEGVERGKRNFGQWNCTRVGIC